MGDVNWHKLSIHFGLSRNRMDCKKVLWHKSSIHLRLCDESDGMEKPPCAQTLHPPTAMPQIRWYGKASLCSNSPSTYSYTNNSMGPLARRTQMSSILTEKEANPMEPKAKSAKMGSIHFGV